MIAYEVAKLMIVKANQADRNGQHNVANVLDAQLRKIGTGKEMYAYHYPVSQSDLKSIRSKGLLAPSELAKTTSFKNVVNNYKERIQNIYNGKITDEVVLDYLDYSRSLMDDTFYFGRNLIFGLLAPLFAGISDGHDQMLEQEPVKIDLLSLSNVKGVKFFMVELPLQDADHASSPATLKDLRWLSGVDLMSFYDEKKADGLSFGNVPHLAIYLPEGKIDKSHLS